MRGTIVSMRNDLPLAEDSGGGYAEASESLLALIKSRRSFAPKDLSPDPLPRIAIERLIEAARWAPNHGKTEPWRFVVYTGEGRRGLGDAFAEAYRLATPEERFSEVLQAAQRARVLLAPAWISLGLLPGTNPRISEEEELLALGGAVQNLFLLATSMGLAGKWTSGVTATHHHTAAFVGLEPPARLLGFAYIGIPAVPPPEGRRDDTIERVRWVTE